MLLNTFNDCDSVRTDPRAGARMVLTESQILYLGRPRLLSNDLMTEKLVTRRAFLGGFFYGEDTDWIAKCLTLLLAGLSRTWCVIAQIDTQGTLAQTTILA